MVRTGSAPHPTFGDALSPVDRVTEIFCGLVMVLTVTLLAANEVPTGPEGVNTLLRAALGGNIAWGFIDGVVYLMSQRYERERQARLLAAVRAATDDQAIRAALEEAVDPELVGPMSADEASRAFSALHALAGRMAAPRVGLTRRDLIGALACFCLCVGSALPAALPFLLFDAPLLALRVSNGVLLASLFVLGFIWAKLIGARPLLTAFGLLLVGGALVGITIALGG
jgi:VIT1/CCC1 family predicted Fe2+/Mn2+ transporter